MGQAIAPVGVSMGLGYSGASVVGVTRSNDIQEITPVPVTKATFTTSSLVGNGDLASISDNVLVIKVPGLYRISLCTVVESLSEDDIYYDCIGFVNSLINTSIRNFNSLSETSLRDTNSAFTILRLTAGSTVDLRQRLFGASGSDSVSIVYQMLLLELLSP